MTAGGQQRMQNYHSFSISLEDHRSARYLSAHNDLAKTPRNLTMRGLQTESHHFPSSESILSSKILMFIAI